jgi:SulP family sulfate permease
VLLIILLSAGPLAEKIPLAALAGILVIVSYHMSEWHSIRFLMKGPTSDKVVLITTFLLTVFIDLTVAVQVGIVLSAFLFMKNMAELTQVKTLTQDGDDEGGAESPRKLKVPPGVEIFSIRGAFFFAAVHKLMEVDRIMAKKPKALVIDMKEVLHMDASGLKVMQRICQECRSRDIRFILSGIHTQPFQVLENANQINEIGEENIKPSLNAVISSLEQESLKD